jgi:predicted DNA-binding transcriptional regulator AlpA
MSVNESSNMQKIEKQLKKQKYRANELAEYLGIGNSSVWLYAKQGKIKAYKISANVTVFDIDEVNASLFGKLL